MNAHVMTGTAAPPTRVLCVDDNSEMTLVLRLMINAEPRMRCVGCLGSADHLLRKVRGLGPPPHVVVLDAKLDGGSGLDVLAALHGVSPEVRFIVFSNSAGDAYRQRYLAAGASRYLDKNAEFDQLAQAVATAGHAAVH